MKNNLRKRVLGNAAMLLLVGAIAFSKGSFEVKAATDTLTEETDWNREGEATYETITEEENKKHTEENNNNLNNGGNTPADQDANAVVDNSQGGDSSELDPIEGGPIDWEHYEYHEGDEHPPKGTPDEVDRKNKIPKTEDKSTNNTAAAATLGGLIAGLGYGVKKIIASNRSKLFGKKGNSKTR